MSSSVSAFQARGERFEQHRRDIADVRNNAADIAASSHEEIREELGGALRGGTKRGADADKIITLIERKLARDAELSYPEIMRLLEEKVLPISDKAEWHANISNILSVIKTGLPDLIWAGIYFVNGDVLELGHGTGYVGMAVLPNGHGVCGTVAATGIPIRVPDTARWRGRISVDHAAKSELAVPLYSKEKVIGVLCLESPKLEKFTEEDEGCCLEIAALLERWHARHGKIYKIFPETKYVVQSDNRIYDSDIVDDATIDLNAAADRLGVSREIILKIIEREAAACEHTIRMDGELRTTEVATRPIPPEALELFGGPAPSKGPRTYTKSKFPEDWFDNKEVVAAARRAAVEYKNRDKSVPLEEVKIARGRAGTRFLKAYERRQAKLKESSVIAQLAHG